MATDLGKVGMVTKGTWNNTATYEVLDVVSYNGGTFIAKQAVPANTAPTNTTYWQTAIQRTTGTLGCEPGSFSGLTSVNDMVIGTYLTAASSSWANISDKPLNSWAGCIYCLLGYGSNPWQLAEQYTGNNFYIRRKAGDTWTDWKKITLESI